MPGKYDTRARVLLRARSHDWTQDQIANVLDCSQPMASDYLSGESRPNDRRRSICEVIFKIPVGDWRTPEEGGPPVPDDDGAQSSARCVEAQADRVASDRAASVRVGEAS